MTAQSHQNENANELSTLVGPTGGIPSPTILKHFVQIMRNETRLVNRSVMLTMIMNTNDTNMLKRFGIAEFTLCFSCSNPSRYSSLICEDCLEIQRVRDGNHFHTTSPWTFCVVFFIINASFVNSKGLAILRAWLVETAKADNAALLVKLLEVCTLKKKYTNSF